MKRLAAAALLLTLGGAVVWGLPWLDHQLDIDRCLDRGGAWDHGRGACEHASTSNREMPSS